VAEERAQRRLAAILAADVVGYSQLMGEDEAGTLNALNKHRAEFIHPTVGEYRGRIVKLMGDGALVEFPSIVDAVECAVAVQRGMEERNADIPDSKRITFRIGINLGDIIIDGDDIYGDGVNVAARLEGLAEPGGICVSAKVFEEVGNKLNLGFEDLGPQEVKNIDEPVRAYRAILDRVASKLGTEPLPLPEKPSIAVLPFENMSGDPEQEYFSDGITEDIITALSKFRWFFVIARNSTFAYKGQAIDIKHVGRELGVRYVLEGSVRKAGNRVRISAQLIEAETGNHLWAERYDRNLEDIFELQDEITQTISAAIEPELFSSEHNRALRKPTDDLTAWDLFQRAVALLWQRDRASIESGIQLIRQAVDLDPKFGQAFGYLAYGAFLLLVYERAEDRDATLKQGIADAQHAIAIDRRDYCAQYALGRLYTMAGDHQAAIRALDTCVAINPNFAAGYVGLEEAHVYGGDPNKAIEYADKATRLSPNDPMLWAMLHYKASAYVRLRDYDQAIEIFEQVCQFPNAQYVPFTTLAALYGLVGREHDARKTLEKARQLEPNLSVALMARVYGNSGDGPFKRGRRLLDALRKAGLPE
jgi:adenylate cyclase